MQFTQSCPFCRAIDLLFRSRCWGNIYSSPVANAIRELGQLKGIPGGNYDLFIRVPQRDRPVAPDPAGATPISDANPDVALNNSGRPSGTSSWGFRAEIDPDRTAAVKHLMTSGDHLIVDLVTPGGRRPGALRAAPAELDHYGWQRHCRGLFELPIAA